ncbi:hypothetical protein [Limnofasciculus baicalensis]|uniref:Uncharacterized protein n=1 Tax=Limnofasciculus baicalensis BBK-W-15 TaxID=2699891 RepID=A0AAE3KUH5_9CYAN|nr:hypothetical protein [Limnofasciculus baicalensis]MCP2731522.1 hypothetical protein [Limnofasciculus baicalensis BBK-W-15]
MAIVLQLDPEVESRLIAQAAAQGKSAEELLKILVERLLGYPAPLTPVTLSPQEKAERFLRWVKSHDKIEAPLLSDEAISRASIYK